MITGSILMMLSTICISCNSKNQSELPDLLKPLLYTLADAGQRCITTTLIDKPWGEDKPKPHS